SWKYGALVGFTMPLLRSFIFHRPMLYPDAVVMMLELAAYGFVSGIIYNKAPKRNILWVYISLVSAMLAGRLVWGIVKALLLGTGKFGLRVFITSGFISALPGIILQLVLIPVIMVIIEKLKPRA
ncbi:MAG: ECF transporter S component, partial [Clostridia bacterium]|nr:ECF transporter S component [Clostridia bacterium]